MYPEEMVQPMREELTNIGFRELKTSEEVDSVLARAQGTSLVVVNSVCGCAAGKARPDALFTVFAGQDSEATARARSYFTGYGPSSPSIALLRDGKLVYMLERHDIEGRDSFAIADDLTSAFDRFCAPARSAASG